MTNSPFMNTLEVNKPDLPFIYLVAEYMQISAPKAKGRWEKTQSKYEQIIETFLHTDFKLEFGQLHFPMSHLEVGRHEGVIDNNHNVFVVIVHQVGTSPNVDNFHSGVGWRLNPHHLHKQQQKHNNSGESGICWKTPCLLIVQLKSNWWQRQWTNSYVTHLYTPPARKKARLKSCVNIMWNVCWKVTKTNSILHLL